MEEFIDVNGRNLFVKSYGEGNAIVFLHRQLYRRPHRHHSGRIRSHRHA